MIPWDGQNLLDVDDERLDDHPGFASWWRQANDQWLANRSSGRLSLLQRLDFMRTLTIQLPAPPHRVVYSASGMYLAAARVDDPNVVIDKKLYWGPVASVEEGRFLTAVFNSDAFTLTVRQYQSRGEHNPRDFDKYVFQLPIPSFDAEDELHRNLVLAAERAEEIVANLELPQSRSRSRGELSAKHSMLTGLLQNWTASPPNFWTCSHHPHSSDPIRR